MDVLSKPLTIPSSQNFTNVQVYLIVPSIIISTSSQSSLPFLRVSVNSLRQNPRLIIPTLVCLYYSQPQCSIQEVQPLICPTNPQSLCSTNQQSLCSTNPRLIIPTLVCLYYSQPQCLILEMRAFICWTNLKHLSNEDYGRERCFIKFPIYGANIR